MGDLFGHARYEAAGLLGLRGRQVTVHLSIPCFLFSRRAAVERLGAHTHGFGALTTTSLVTPGFGFSRLRWGGSSCRCYSWGSM